MDFKVLRLSVGYTRLIALFLFSFILIGCSNEETEREEDDSINPYTAFTYPIAEWQQAKVVFAHVPGQELWGLHGRNKTFDVEGMRAEWFEYMNVLKGHNIQVFELTDVLMKLPVTQLRDLAQKMFHISFDKKDKSEIIKYMIETPPLKAIYYTRDQSITTPRGSIICKMASPHRQFEPDIIALCYQYLGGKIYYRISGSQSRMEGGDYFPFGTLSFIGEGQRTNREAIQELMTADAIGHDTLVVVKDALKNIYQMHLDTYFNIIDRDLVTMSEVRMDAPDGSNNYLAADVYARAPGELSYHLENENISFVSFLKQRGITIIPINSADQEKLANNYLCIKPRHIIARSGLSDNFKNAMKAHDVTVEWVKLDELVEGDGAAHCMTQVIGRSDSE